jgi:hypothetical protein
MKINAFYESMHLSIVPTRTEWQGENDYVVVLKLWEKNLEWQNNRISCQTPSHERPEGQRGGKWDRRQKALDAIHSGRKLGFFTIGKEGSGKQREYEGFREDVVYRVREIITAVNGTQWVHFDRQLVSLDEVRNLAKHGPK